MKKIIGVLFCFFAVIMVAGENGKKFSYHPSAAYSHMKDHKKQAVCIALFAFLCRPMIQVVQQLYNGEESIQHSLYGYNIEFLQDLEKIQTSLSLGSLNFGITVPNNMLQKFKRLMYPSGVFKSLKSIPDVINNFSAQLLIVLKAGTSPVSLENEELTKRLEADFSCGDYALSTGVDVQESVIAPLALFASYVTYAWLQNNQITNTNSFVSWLASVLSSKSTMVVAG